jgi:hypothetical protein
MTLTRLEHRWARDALDAIFPPGGDPRLPTGIADLDVDGFLDDLTRAWPPMTLLAFRLAVLTIGLSAFVVVRTLRPFHRLTRAERQRVLEAIYASRIYFVRQFVTLLKATGGMLYGAAPAVRDVIAPARPPSDAPVALRRREVHAP